MVDNISGQSDVRTPFVPNLSDENKVVNGKALLGEKKDEVSSKLDPGMVSEITKSMEAAAAKLGSPGADLMSILATVMSNLTKMTKTLQSIAMTQAEELRFLSKMQALYTDLISKVPIYDTVKNFPPEIKKFKDGKPDMDEQKVIDYVNQANQRSSILTDGLRSLRDPLGEDAKKKQAEINTSDDAQKGMLDFMQTFLQKQREWLSSIFR